MSFKPLTLLKEHPWAVAGGVFVIGVILVIIFAGGSEDTGATVINAAPDNSGAIAASASAYQAQLGAQVANAQTSAQQAVAIDTNKTTFELAKLQADTQQNAAVIGGIVSLQNIKSTSASRDLETTSSLSAHLSDNSTALAVVQDNNATKHALAAMDYDVARANIYSMERLNATQMNIAANVRLNEIGSNERITASDNAVKFSTIYSQERIQAQNTASLLEQSRAMTAITQSLIARG